MGSKATPLLFCVGAKMVLHTCVKEVSAKMEVHTNPIFDNILASMAG
jgi:hypothetical protein